ncbi:MAG: MarR family transcriptional regulator [Pyrodictiaceae archaeon]
MPRKPIADPMILAAIANEPGLSISELSRRLGLSKSTVSSAVRRLERKGLVKRTRRGLITLIYPVEEARGTEQNRVAKLGIIRALEYPFVIGFSKKMREIGIHVKITVYENGLDATFDLVRGKLDLVLSPLVTQFYFYALTRALTIIGGGAYGGSVIVKARVQGGEAYTTMASTMEACLNASGLMKGIVKRYAFSGDEILEALAKGKAAYAILWEPYASRAKAYGKEVANCSELGLSYCCTLASRRGMSLDLLSKMAAAYREALEEQRKRPYKWLEEYSKLIGIELEEAKRAIKRYKYNEALDPNEAEKNLRLAGIATPSPHIVKSAILIV